MKIKSGFGKGQKSIGKRLAGAVLIPSVTLLVMWVSVSGYLLFNGFYVREVAAGVRQVSIPAIAGFASAQKERQLSMAYLGEPATGLQNLHAQEQQTDVGLAAMKSAAVPLLQNAPQAVVDHMRTLSGLLDQLPRIRSQIDAGSIDQPHVYAFYNNLLNAAASLFDTQARIVPDAVAVQGAIAASSVFRASDLMSRAGSLIAGAFASGQLSEVDHLQFTQLIGSYHGELDKTAPFLRPDMTAQFGRLAASDPWKRLVATENALVEHGPWSGRQVATLPVGAADWQALTDQVSNELITMVVGQADEVSSQALDDGTSQFTGVIIGSVVALLAAVAAIMVAMRVSRTLVDRGLVTRLARLRNDSLELAHDRLPDIVRRLRDGETVDVNEELPELDYGADEIGQVAEAFNAAQYTAVSAAVKEAQAREGVHNVFLGIAHRNQGLVHRQLKLLDTMEREEEAPEQLERLFQLDHLATRARRNAENLIILGGEQPGRRWRKPVPLIDVLRAAISETELYYRVKVERVPEVSVLGSSVADTIHLVAELVDNATSFSPPRSQVHLNSTLVARGVVVEVEDQGLGMNEEDRDRANLMMAKPPEFDAMALKADSRFGLFVIARLAARLGIKVEFRVSPYGGTRAIVLFPAQILVQDGQLDNRGGPALPLSRRGVLMPSDYGREPAGLVGSVELDGYWDPGRSRLPSTVGVVSGIANTVVSSTVVATGEIEYPPVVRVTENPLPPSLPAVLPPGPQHAVGPEPTPSAAGEATKRARLPQRRPQQNLARQLRDEEPPDGSAPPPDNGRSPDEVRDTMSAYQKGSIEGRHAGEPSDS